MTKHKDYTAISFRLKLLSYLQHVTLLNLDEIKNQELLLELCELTSDELELMSEDVLLLDKDYHEELVWDEEKTECSNDV